MSRYRLPDMFEAVFRSLNDRGVRYLVAGGVAVVLHGHMRYTPDLDLLVDTSTGSTPAIEALAAVGLHRRVPANPASPDDRQRAQWLRDRGITVDNLRHPDNPMMSVDLCTTQPSAFDALWSGSEGLRFGEHCHQGRVPG